MFMNFLRLVADINGGGVQPMAALSHSAMDAYIDRRAMEEIERALMSGADGEGEAGHVGIIKANN